jgi:hypothetical protein
MVMSNKKTVTFIPLLVALLALGKVEISVQLEVNHGRIWTLRSRGRRSSTHPEDSSPQAPTTISACCQWSVLAVLHM